MSSATNAAFVADLAKQHELLGTAVEIGVYRGDFSRPFLDAWPGERMYLIDLWNLKPRGKMLRGNHQHMLATIAAVRPHQRRVILLKQTSLQAVQQVADGSVSVLFDDGLHTRDACLADLCQWWPKLEPGGLFAGHDFRQNCGVPDAVREFARRVDVPFTVVDEVDTPAPNAIWYMFKDV